MEKRLIELLENYGFKKKQRDDNPYWRNSKEAMTIIGSAIGDTLDEVGLIMRSNVVEVIANHFLYSNHEIGVYIPPVSPWYKTTNFKEFVNKQGLEHDVLEVENSHKHSITHTILFKDEKKLIKYIKRNHKVKTIKTLIITGDLVE